MQDLILKYTLQNAVKYKGKANPNAIMGHILKENPKLKKEIKKLSKEIQKQVEEINKLSLQEQTEKLLH